jgi:hypothetical protein
MKALLSHCHPDASFAEVLGVLLNEYIERHSPQARQKRRDERCAAAAGGTSSTVGADGECKSASPRSRHIPVGVRDQVHARDGGRCSYIAPNGVRCQSRHALQIDHIRPYAAGGTHDASNLRLLCRAHNRLAAEHTLGEHVIRRYWRRA